MTDVLAGQKLKFVVLTEADGTRSPVRLAVHQIVGYEPILEESEIRGTAMQLPGAIIQVLEGPTDVDLLIMRSQDPDYDGDVFITPNTIPRPIRQAGPRDD